AVEANAADVLADSCDFSLKTAGHANYNDSWDYGNWNVTNGANNNNGWGYVKFGGKQATLSSANPCYFNNKTAIDDQITKVTVKIADGSLSKANMSVNSWGLYVYSDSTLSTQVDYVAGGTITKSAASFNFVPSTGTYWAEKCFYKISFDLANTTTTNGIVCVESASLYKNSDEPEKTLTSISVEGSMKKTEYTTAESWDPDGLTVTAHYDDDSTLDVTNDAEWEFDPSAPALGVTSVTATATYEEKTADSDPQTVTVTEYVADSYEKVISTQSDWSGEYLLVYEPSASTAYVWTGVDVSNCYVEASIVNNQITKPLGSVSLTIASMTGGYSIKINGGDNNEKFIGRSASSNGLDFKDSEQLNTLSYSDGYANICGEGIKDGANVQIKYNKNSGQDRFRYYTSGQQSVQLYKKVEPYTISKFVSDWNTATNAACSNPDADNTTAITNAWSGIKANYLKLSAADQAKVATGEDPTPASLLERYDHIVERYGLENFMNRSVTPSPRINVLPTMNDNGSIAIIVIVSLLSVTAIGTYFYIRRRRQHN
ncbi:MAG: transmembrane domain-containing protein, partial [Clostridia bacterium]|nr:transmembrane domain-containing protein [Clostridia bacterium]